MAMAARFIPSRILNYLTPSLRILNNRFSGVSKNGVEEIEMIVPWGHIAGKWYGSKDIRPIVGLHGWQDNAGTFDTLAPLLPSHVGFLSLDLPGHGLSSRIPDGMLYNSIDYIFVLRLLMRQYNWDKISLLTHSMSSIIGFCFASLFPDKVDMLIGMDALKPHVRPLEKIPETIANRMENFIIADERNRDKSEPPSYTYDECVEKLHKGTNSSRCLQMAERIIAPYLFIKVLGSPYYEDKRYFDETIEILRKNDKFEKYEIDGTHHVHLNEPKKISTIINPFICKYYITEKCTGKN